MAILRLESLELQSLAAHYANGGTAEEVIEFVSSRIDSHTDASVWIYRLPREQLMEQASQVQERRKRGEMLPLFGVPFGVKDNIDVAGVPTTAACPAFAYVPRHSAPAVDKLLAAGAICIGKTNLDQFATGLVGTRSPYGSCRNVFDPRYIAGGSSSGSGVAVAAGQVSFALGTDTAGSGRVPAAFNNIVGLKPSRGRISTVGVVPACRSLDCVSILTLTCEDAAVVADVITGYDENDPYARRSEEFPVSRLVPLTQIRFGVPVDSSLRFFGNDIAAAQYRQAVTTMTKLGATPVTIDFQPFARASRLLYEGPWVAERLEAVKDLMADCPEAFLPVIRTIIQAARRFDGVSVFEGFYELRALARHAEAEWRKIDLLFLPTTGTIYTLEEVERDPIQLNVNLGYYTNFVNLLDQCGVAVPSGFGSDGLPTGVTLLAPAGREAMLLKAADQFHRSQGLTMGATGISMTSNKAKDAQAMRSNENGLVRLAVVGAHLSGQPLNHQLTDRQARLVQTCSTAPLYRLFALPNTTPPKPGLIRTDAETGAAVEVEVWELTTEAFGSFVAAVPPPMVIGTLQLADGTSVKGFMCEGCATAGAKDISRFGGWRAFLASL